MTWEQLQQAYAPLKEQGIPAVLMGTAGLWAYGIDLEPPDIDFLVQGRPKLSLLLDDTDPEASTAFVTEIGGMRVHFVPVGASKFTPKAMPKCYAVINEIPIMLFDEILALKKSVGRAKDLEFLNEVSRTGFRFRTED